LKEDAEEETTANVGPTLLQESMASESATATLRASSVLGLQRSVHVQKRRLKEGAEEETNANVGPMLLQESMASKSSDVPLSAYSVLGLQRSVRRQKVHLKEDADDGTDAHVAPMFLQESDSMDAPLPSSSILGLQRSVGVRKTAAGAYPDPVLLQESMVGAAAKVSAGVLGLQRRTKLKKGVLLLEDRGLESSNKLPSSEHDEVDPHIDAKDLGKTGLAVGLQRGIVVNKALLAQEEDAEGIASDGVWLQRSSVVVSPKKTPRGTPTVTRAKLVEAHELLTDGIISEADFAAIKDKYMQEVMGPS